MNVVTLHPRRSCPFCGRLERDDLEGHAENPRYLFGEFLALAQLVAGPAQPSAHNLLAEQLRHEWPQPDNVRHGITIPALSEHPHAYDAANIPARRVQRTLQLLCQFLEPLGVYRAALLVRGPVGLPNRV